MRELKQKRVLVTGGAGGIGQALALRFAREGAELVLADLEGDALGEAAAAIRRTGARAATYLMDVSNARSVEDAHRRIVHDGGPPDVLVNNAGVVFGGPFLEVPLDRHEQTYRVNLVGLATVTHVFLPDLVTRPEAHLVNMASASGFIGLPYGSTYASSKWGVIGLSESIRLELEMLGHRQLKVTTVCPSYVDTGLFEGVRPPLLSRLLTPERLAAQVVRAVKKDRAFVLAPRLVRLAPLLGGLLPTRWMDRVSRLLGVTRSMVSWKGRPGT